MTPVRYSVDVIVTTDDADTHARVQKALVEIMERFHGQEGILSTGMGMGEPFGEVTDEAEQIDVAEEGRPFRSAVITDPATQEEFMAGFEEARDG
jgi:hypothetical protein